MAGLLNNSTGYYGEGKHVPGKDKPRERKPESLSRVMSGLGFRIQWGPESTPQMKLSKASDWVCHHCVLKNPAQHLAQYCNKLSKDFFKNQCQEKKR